MFVVVVAGGDWGGCGCCSCQLLWSPWWWWPVLVGGSSLLFCVSKAFFVGFLSLLSFGDFFLRNHKNQAEAGYSIFRREKLKFYFLLVVIP